MHLRKSDELQSWEVSRTRRKWWVSLNSVFLSAEFPTSIAGFIQVHKDDLSLTDPFALVFVL